jgi:hypothetical protein
MKPNARTRFEKNSIRNLRGESPNEDRKGIETEKKVFYTLPKNPCFSFRRRDTQIINRYFFFKITSNRR